MSLDREQLREHCETILWSRRIKNNIVVLCEGDVQSFAGRRSPQSYRRMEQRPDASFYRACIPKWWVNFQQPQFFNCGNRNSVLNSYFKLLELHREDSSKSYLNPEKLFAIADLDIQSQPTPNYDGFLDTEAIYSHLYREGQVNERNAANHKIWVTGLIHKEAYFIIPELKPIFEESEQAPIYQDSPVLLEKIYRDMAQSICEDKDLESRFKVVSQRIDYCLGLDCDSASKLQESWKNQFDTAEEQQCINLIMALLTVRKAKPYWEQIEPSRKWNHSHKVFREQLSLKIAEFYSQQERDAKYHLSVFFKTLFKAR
ncbi:MAG: hypothetical protein F6J93_33685 [Oscillatoria sp. SIO1A7]|nr:hypothetical protein [Oscillatoria sp. SIO1A7]